VFTFALNQLLQILRHVPAQSTTPFNVSAVLTPEKCSIILFAIRALVDCNSFRDEQHIPYSQQQLQTLSGHNLDTLHMSRLNLLLEDQVKTFQAIQTLIAKGKGMTTVAVTIITVFRNSAPSQFSRGKQFTS
jgi:hypothetical protein